MLTIHGRTREEKGQLVAAADWDMVARVTTKYLSGNLFELLFLFFVNKCHEKIKKHFAGRVPIVCNGGISNLDDLKRFKVMYIIKLKY